MGRGYRLDVVSLSLSESLSEHDENAAQLKESQVGERLALVADDQAMEVPSQAKRRTTFQRLHDALQRAVAHPTLEVAMAGLIR